MSEITSQPKPDTATKQPVASPKSPEIAGKTPIAEIGGPTGPEPTRYGDWERGGRCSDF